MLVRLAGAALSAVSTRDCGYRLHSSRSQKVDGVRGEVNVGSGDLDLMALVRDWFGRSVWGRGFDLCGAAYFI